MPGAYLNRSGRFGAFEIDDLGVLYRDIIVTAIEQFFGRADTMTAVFGKNEILGG